MGIKTEVMNRDMVIQGHRMNMSDLILPLKSHALLLNTQE